MDAENGEAGSGGEGSGGGGGAKGDNGEGIRVTGASNTVTIQGTTGNIKLGTNYNSSVG